MSTCKFTISDRASVERCPECGNRTRFTGHSEQVAEDCCEVWVTCVCGLDPHGRGERLEDVWGGLTRENLLDALRCWNDAVMNYEERSRTRTKETL